METEKQVAVFVDAAVILIIIISLFTADWDWLLDEGDLNQIILMVVLGVYTLFFCIAVIVTL